MPTKKESLFNPNGRPLSISSLDSEELQSGEQSPYDIRELEKDSETLSRKAAKRLKRSYTTQSESFLEKFISWHGKKKVDKIKSSLDSLFPRLKNSESTIKTWLTSVSERKEQAWSHGNQLLIDMESQISIFQKHLDFLDEVVNDIRQIDYDILKEVTELRIAFAFNQELLNRPSPKPSFFLKHSDSADVAHITVHSSSNSNSSSSGSGSATSDDIKNEQFAEPAVWQQFGTAQGKVLGAKPAAIVQTKPAKSIMSSLMHSVGGGGSGSPHGSPVPSTSSRKTSSPQAVPPVSKAASSSSAAAAASGTHSTHPSPSNGKTVMKPVLTIDARAEAVLTSANKSHLPPHPSSSTPTGTGGTGGGGGAPLSRSRSASGHRSTNSLDGGLDNLIWDGEESKRKSMALSNVSLTSLNLGGGGSSDSPTAMALNRAGSSSPMFSGSGSARGNNSPMVKSNSAMSFLPAFTRSNSASFTGTGPDMTQTTQQQVRGRSSSLNGKNDAANRDNFARCNTPPNLTGSKPIQFPQPSTPISRSRTVPSGYHSGSGDSQGNGTPTSGGGVSHTYSSSDESGTSQSDDEVITPGGLLIVTPKYGSARKSMDGSNGGSGAGKKLSLHRLLLKVDSHEYDLDHLQTNDADQLEMAKRIKKCLTLKDTLKMVLTTVQTTQDTETVTLKKMKKLRNELKTVCTSEEAMSKDATFCSLNQVVLESFSYSNSNAGSANNLQALNYSSDDNNNSTGKQCRELRAYSNTPPSLLQQSFHSNNTSGYSVGSRRNSSPTPYHPHTPSARIPIPSQNSLNGLTPSQSAAVAASGVAAFSFMTTATTGSDKGEKVTEEEKLSICSRSPSIDGEHLNFEEAALEVVVDLKALIQEESEAKKKLAKLSNLIDNANQISQQLLLTTTPTAKAK